MNARNDATNAQTTPFGAAAPQHELLAGMAGNWRGTTRTWLDPNAAPEETPTEATAEMLLGGRFLRIDYRGTVAGKPHAGQMIVGFHNDAQSFELLQIDSFHTGSMMMLSTGPVGPGGAVSVLGSYPAGNERWGWRTVLRRDAEELVIEAFNIAPDGQEFPAIETRLRRA
jgi:hypothetical protein